MRCRSSSSSVCASSPVFRCRDGSRPNAAALNGVLRLMPDDLVARAQAGDQTAFRDLYRQHAGRVYALCLRLTGDARDADERTQDVFVRLWDKLGSFRGESAFSSWLHRLAVNVVLNERRTTGRRERRVTLAEDPAVLEKNPGTSLEGLSIDLERAIAGLPDGAREVFVLYDIEG